MSRLLLNTGVASPGGHVLARSRWSAWPVSLAAHTLAIGGVFLLPLVTAPELPAVPFSGTVYVSGPEPPAPPPPPPLIKIGSLPDTLKSLLAAPLDAPEGIRPESGVEPMPAEPAAAELGSGIVPGTEMNLLDELARTVVPPIAAPADPVRPGVLIVEPRKIHDVRPVYPPLALAAHVEGVVIIEAIIGTGGEVEDIRVLRSAPLLDEAARDAVRQWRYTPTLLNGVPVRVIMTVTVNFRLKDEA